MSITIQQASEIDKIIIDLMSDGWCSYEQAKEIAMLSLGIDDEE